MSLLSTSVSSDAAAGINGVPLSGSRGSRSKSSWANNSDGDAPDFGAVLKAASSTASQTSSDSAPSNTSQSTPSNNSIKNERNKKKSDSDDTSDESSTTDASANDSDAKTDPQKTADASAKDSKDQGSSKDQAKPQDDKKAATPDPSAITAQVIPHPQPAAAASAPAKDSTSTPVAASPFLNAFGGIAEGLHRQQLARQAKAGSAESPATATANNSADARKNASQAAADAAPQEQVIDPQAIPQNTKNKPAIPARTNLQPANDQVDASPADPMSAAALAQAIPQADSVDAEVAALTGQLPPDGGVKSTATPATSTVISIDGPAPKSETTSAVSAGPAQESPAPDPQQLLDQVVLGLQGKFDAQNGKAQIQLDPPNLGHIQVSVTLQNGTLTAEFQSSSELVRGLLKDNIGKLKTVLEGQGVAVDKLAVDAPPAVPAQGQGQQASFGSAAHDGRSAGQHNQDPRPNQRRPGENETFARLLNQAGRQAPINLVA